MLRFSRVLASPVSTSTFVICLSLALSPPSPLHRSPPLAAPALAVSSTSPHPISPFLSLPPPAVFSFSFFIRYSTAGCAPPSVPPSRYVLCAFFTFTSNSANLLYSALHAISFLLVLRACCISGSVHLSAIPPFITLFHRPSNS